ncbi:HNH endonuclease [Clostridium botulinum]|uniref:Putative HNH nuclease YajD n=1 Tax=Clostridium botulinum TaxID=1491 RepID=A0A6M0SNX9_CLOBO|nr:HNH endonuclease [Clostridium botulinum]NFA42126.1 HNH endonuclease [Clostridium botulinum]
MIYKQCNKCGKRVEADKQCECIIKAKKNYYKDYKKNRNDNKEQSFYSSKDWITIRDTIKTKDNSVCIGCLMNNSISNVDYVHHIETIKDNWNKRLDKDNLICLCSSCHRKVHDMYNKSSIDKRLMQEELFGLIEKFKKEYL